MVTIMVIKVCEESLDRYQAIIENVAKTYVESLISHIPFDAKLKALTVKLTLESSRISWGLTQKAGNIYVIVLGINPNYSDTYNTFIIAHEFAHLLFARISDTIGIVGLASDGSKPFTNIVRQASDGTLWGEEFEEQCADISALYILKKMDIEVDSLLSKDLEKSKDRRSLCESFINSFGTSLEELPHFDEYITNQKFEGIPCNYFWYFVINSELSGLITMYNAKTFSNAFYIVISIIEGKNPQSAIDLSDFRFAS